jgi:FkbM family methyltransferase
VAGEITIGGGIAVGMRLDARHVPITHPQAYELIRGVAEPGVQEALRRTIFEGSVVWDVGANVGFISLVAARLGARVYALEPSPENAQAVRDHASMNKVDIDVIEAAAAEVAGRADFLLVEERSWSHLADRGSHGGTESTITVDVVRLDDLGLPAPDVVKIDVEGSEGAVLRGMERTLAERRPVIICELHETNEEVAALLEAAGYRLENLDGPEPVRRAGAIRLLARPQEN